MVSLSVNRMRIEYDVQRIDALKKLNDEFLLVKIYAMAPGKNRNFTYISKEDVIEAIPSAYYCPVVGHVRVYTDENGNEHVYMGSHDFEITEDWEIKDVTRPYGVIVEGSEGWETVDEHGKEVEYLTFNAILWTGRYPELEEAAYSDDILFNQSMEINIDNYRQLEDDSNYWEVLGFTFSAFCLLGKADENSTNGHTDKDVEHTEPAFISAKVVPYELTIDEFKKEFSLLKDKISQFCLTNETVNDSERGNSMADENKNVNTAVTDFEEDSVTDVTVDSADVEETVSEEPVVEDENYEETQTDGADNEGSAEDVTEEETTEEPVEGTPDYEALYNGMKDAYEGVVASFESYKADHTHTDAEYQTLVAYKETREKADREHAESELFNSFADRIGTTEEFEALKNEASNYSLEELKLRLYAIVGMHSIPVQEEKTQETLKFNLGSDAKDDTEKDPYGNAREYFS